jgi:hypothetical protein
MEKEKKKERKKKKKRRRRRRENWVDPTGGLQAAGTRKMVIQLIT